MMTFSQWMMLREGTVKTHVPTVRQETDYSCGAAALMAVFKYFRVGPKTEEEIRKLLDTNSEDGTRTKNIIKVARKFGLETKAKYNMDPHDLKKWLDEEKPIIVCLQAWGKKKHYKTKDSGHYVVAIGYDKNNVYFQDPSLTKTRGHIPWKEFIKRWHDKDASGDRDRYGIAVWKEGGRKQKEVIKRSKRIN
jgi:uncharacterized protein